MQATWTTEKAHGGERVHCERAGLAPIFELEPVGKLENDWRDRGGDVPVTQIEEKEAANLDWHVLRQIERAETVGLEGGKTAQDGRRAENQADRRRPDFFHSSHYLAS